MFAGSEAETACEFFSPQSEYRPTEYLQQWCRFWFDGAQRLAVAKQLQQLRLHIIARTWPKHAWTYDAEALSRLLTQYTEVFAQAADSMSLLAAEGRFSAQLYALANRATLNQPEFKRSQRGNSVDPANRFLDHGNYLAYGMGATACWVLGLPHGLAVLHGKTRRGGLVFDAADIVKDAMILPQAFIAAAEGASESEFRQNCIAQLTRFEALDTVIEGLQSLAKAGAA